MIYKLLVLSICLGVLVADSCERRRTPDKYIIPADYRGWIVITYGVSNALPLRVSNGYNEILISNKGIFETSSPLQDGWANDLYYFSDNKGLVPIKATEPGKGGMIWGGNVNVIEGEGNGRKIKKQRFFIGSEEEFNRAVKSDNLNQAR